MSLSELDIVAISQDEERRWREVHTAILAEIRRTYADYQQDRALARELTSEIVATRREEDKAQLASDEAVAHGLTKLRKNKSEGLLSLAEQPYFARVVTEEGGREVEFRLGTASYPDMRIIDWRKAPISKLYYDYREGQDFSEVIQGKEREGVIKLRRSYHGTGNELNVIEATQGTLLRSAAGWKLKPGSGEPESGKPESQRFSRNTEHDGHLPPILSLITSEQFDLITREARRPVVIQGIAGSGKTTVALHRLAWMLHEDNSSCRPEKCLVVMFNRSLKAYVETTLPELKIPNVPIMTFTQWVNQLVGDVVGVRPRGVIQKSQELDRFKSSALCLRLLHQYLENRAVVNPGTPDFVQQLFGFFTFLTQQEVLWPRWEMVKQQLQEQVVKKLCDASDDSILLHLVYAEHGYYPTKSPKSLGLCDHLVIDEAQDFGAVEIRALLNAVDRDRTVTLVGDVAQKIVMSRDFGSWEELLTEAGFEESAPIQLTVSYRSTNQIIALVSRFRGESEAPAQPAGPQAAGRNGPLPIFIQVESLPVMAHIVGQWIEARLKERTLSAVICRWARQAEQLVEVLRKQGHASVRLGHRDQFDFSPGVVVTNVHQVKGLEFRNVLVVEPSEENYHAGSEEERNLLYVAMTRAEWRLDFIGVQKPSSLLAELRRVRGAEVAAWIR